MNGMLGSPNGFNKTYVDAGDTAAIASAAAAEIVAVAARDGRNGRWAIRSSKVGSTGAGANERHSDFFTIPGSGLVLTLDATTTAFKYDINGVVYTLSANKTLNCTNTADNWVYIGTDETLYTYTKPPTYSMSAPGAPSANDHWFDLAGGGQMYKYSGAAWVAEDVICIGAVRADGGNINAAYGCEPAALTPWTRRFYLGNGSDGYLSITAGTTTINTFKQYTGIMMTGGTITQTGGTGVILIPIICCQSARVLLGTSSVSFAAKSAAAVSGGTGAGTAGGNLFSFGGQGGGGGGSPSAAGGKGGNISSLTFGNNTAGNVNGGASGAAGTVGIASAISQTGGIPFGAFVLGGASYGAGGGAGAGDSGNNGGNGGIGGGCAVLRASFVVIGSTATQTCSGGAGANGSAGNTGAGGGGGGGLVDDFAFSEFDYNGSTNTAAGGAGGTGAGTGKDGGAGGAGYWNRVRPMAA